MSSLDIDESPSMEDQSPAMKESIGTRMLRNKKNINYDDSLDTVKNSNLRGVRRRTISKAPQNDVSSLNDLSPKSIKKIYLNKNLSKLKKTNLETIFEEEDSNEDDSPNLLIDHQKIFGVKKVKRELSFSDGFATKRLKTKRQKRVKLLMGKAKKGRKMSMQYFMQQFSLLESIKLENDGFSANSLPAIA